MDKFAKVIEKAFGDFTKNDLTPFLAREMMIFLGNNPDENQETLTNSIEHLNGKIKELFKSTPKKRTPKKTPKNDENDENCYLTIEKAIEYANEHPDEIRCQWRIPRGDHKDTICNKVTDGDWSDDDKKYYRIRCKCCKRNNSEKSNIRNAEFYENYELRNGAMGGVKASPLAEADDDEKETAKIGGLKEGVTSPVPDPAENFLEGKNTTVHSPSSAKKGKKTPEPISVTKIKKYGETDEYTDFRSSKKFMDQFYLLMRRSNGQKSFVCGGKFRDDFDIDNIDSLYTQAVVELEEDEIKQVLHSKVSYEYCGQARPTKSKSPENDLMDDIPVIQSEEEEDDEDIDKMMAELENE